MANFKCFEFQIYFSKRDISFRKILDIPKNIPNFPEAVRKVSKFYQNLIFFFGFQDFFKVLKGGIKPNLNSFKQTKCFEISIWICCSKGGFSFATTIKTCSKHNKYQLFCRFHKLNLLKIF
jgi:hypothetical protein